MTKNIKIKEDYLATIPDEIKKALKLKVGDTVVFRLLSDGTVIMKKADSLDAEYLKALESTLSEWKSKNDEEDFSDLQDL